MTKEKSARELYMEARTRYLVEEAICTYEDNISDMGGDVYIDASHEYAADIADSEQIIRDLKRGKYNSIRAMEELMGEEWIKEILLEDEEY